MAFCLEIFPAHGDRFVELSEEKIRPSSLIVPNVFGKLIFRAAHCFHDGPMDSGLIMPSGAEVEFYSRTNEPRVERDRRLDRRECKTLDELVANAVEVNAAMFTSGYTRVMGMSANEVTQAQLSALQKIGADLTRRSAPGMMPAEPMSYDDPHIGLYL